MIGPMATTTAGILRVRIVDMSNEANQLQWVKEQIAELEAGTRLAELRAEAAELEAAVGKENAPKIERIAKIQEEMRTLMNELTALADETNVQVNLRLPCNQARGAGGMTYYPKNDPNRYSDEWSYVKPDDYGGWRSSATDMC